MLRKQNKIIIKNEMKIFGILSNNPLANNKSETFKIKQLREVLKCKNLENYCKVKQLTPVTLFSLLYMNRKNGGIRCGHNINFCCVFTTAFNSHIMTCLSKILA